jgi:hypothetical protein
MAMGAEHRVAQLTFYRYTDDYEAAIIQEQARIDRAPHQTCKWYSPNRFESGVEAQRYLALGYTPTHRIGPVPQDEMPDFDHAALRLTGPNFGEPGGALEAATTQPLYLFTTTAIPAHTL